MHASTHGDISIGIKQKNIHRTRLMIIENGNRSPNFFFHVSQWGVIRRLVHFSPGVRKENDYRESPWWLFLVVFFFFLTDEVLNSESCHRLTVNETTPDGADLLLVEIKTWRWLLWMMKWEKERETEKRRRRSCQKWCSFFLFGPSRTDLWTLAPI